LRAVVERLLREGRAEARSDGTTHVLFCVAASAAGGEALRGWAVSEGAIRTVEVGLGSWVTLPIKSGTGLYPGDGARTRSTFALGRGQDWRDGAGDNGEQRDPEAERHDVLCDVTHLYALPQDVVAPSVVPDVGSEALP
jgi:hypothetical protein